jgi:hypothetical protein
MRNGGFQNPNFCNQQKLLLLHIVLCIVCVHLGDIAMRCACNPYQYTKTLPLIPCDHKEKQKQKEKNKS